jgi:hypothetical protein
LNRFLPILLALSLGATPLAAQPATRGFDPGNMDTSVSPCADFFQYAVGAWEKRTTIPAEYSKYGVDQEVEERTFAILNEILRGLATLRARDRAAAREAMTSIGRSLPERLWGAYREEIGRGGERRGDTETGRKGDAE